MLSNPLKTWMVVNDNKLTKAKYILSIHLTSTSTPQIDTWAQSNTKYILWWPVNKVQVEIILKFWSIKHFEWYTWYLANSLQQQASSYSIVTKITTFLISTTLFHVRGQNLVTELSLWSGQSCGTVCQRQFVTQTVYTLERRLKSHFLSLCFSDWQCNALQVWFRACRALNSLLLSRERPMWTSEIEHR